jgi:hypothetical protein
MHDQDHRKRSAAAGAAQGGRDSFDGGSPRNGCGACGGRRSGGELAAGLFQTVPQAVVEGSVHRGHVSTINKASAVTLGSPIRMLNVET